MEVIIIYLKKRSSVQLFFFVLLAIVAISKNFSLNILPNMLNVLNTISPIGGVVNTVDFFTGGASLVKEDGLIVLGSLIFALTIGPIFCGWLCPFGAFQEFVYKLSEKRFLKLRKKLNSNKSLLQKLSVLRYISLLFVIILTLNGFHLILSNIDPTYSLFYIPLGNFNILGALTLILLIFIGLFIERFWCRYLCPYGALLGILNKIKIFKITRKEQTCIECKQCSKSCPMGIEITSYEGVDNLSCISCMDCIDTNICPRENTLLLQSSIKGKEAYKFIASEFLVIWFAIVFIIPFYYKVSSFTYAQEVDSIIVNSSSISLDSGNFKDGVYVGEGTGYKSIIKVKLKIKNGKMEDVKVISHDETNSYAKIPVEVIPNKILDSQSTNVDVITGATWTSNGIIDSVNNALNKSRY